MKTRSQKLISLVLVLMMLVTMIPAGIFGASAVSAELEAALADYDNSAEFVVNNAADWEAIAASGMTFSGKTVKLGGDLDFGGATVTPLFNSKPFKGTFDGQGYTIKNAVVSGSGSMALIAPVLGGGTITNVNIDNVSVSTTSDYAGLIFAQNEGYNISSNVEISKIKATNITVNNNGGRRVGGLFGTLDCRDAAGATVVIKQINFQGAVNHNSTYGEAGGFIATLISGASLQISQIYTDIDFYANKPADPWIGGFIGYLDVRSAFVAEDIYVGGSFDHGGQTSYLTQHCGAFGVMCVPSTPTPTIKNFVLAIDMSAAPGATTFVATILGGSVNLTDVYTTTASSGDSAALNGTLTTITPEEAASHFEMDENGFILHVVKPDVVIDSIEDWNAVANTFDTYAGKLVVLGADLDFEGATIKPLFNNWFYGTFDGQGYTIKNAVISSEGSAALIAPCFGGGTITNVNFDNITVSGAGYVGLVAGTNEGYSLNSNVEISKIKATNITINNAGTYTGGLIGRMDCREALGMTLTITQINLQGAVNHNNTAGGQAGGFIGALITGATTTLSQINVDVDLYANQPTDPWVGGFIAYLAIMDASNPTVIENVYIGGSLNHGGATSYLSQYGGMLGVVLAPNGGGATLKNIVFAMDMSQASGVATICATILNTTPITLTDVYSTIASSGDSTNMNGTMTVITPEEAAGTVTLDEDGFIDVIAQPLSVALANYASTSTFVIKSVADWNAVAAYSAANNPNWSGKTIVLGADLIGEVDENGAPTTVLNQLSPAQFYGTFDGNNYTIKNVKAAGNTFFTAKIDGTTFKNVTFDNAVVNAASYSGIFTGIVNDWASSTFSNITIKNTAVTSASGDSGILAAIVDNKQGTLTFKDITILNSSLNGGTHTGALFGSLQTQNANTNLLIDGVKMDNVTVSNKSDATVGGLIGWTRPYGDATTTLTIKNVTMTNMTVTSGENYATGGLIGRINHTNYGATIENIVITGSVTTTSATATDYVGGVVGRIDAAGAITFKNIYSDMTVTAVEGTVMIGGFCAYIGGLSAAKQFVLKDSYIGGAIVANSAHSTSTAGVVNKFAGAAGEDIANISNIVVDVDMAGAAGNAVTIFGVHDGNVLLEKCYSVTKSNGGIAESGKVRWSFMSHNDTSFINGVANPWTGSDVAGDKFVTIIGKQAAELMAKKDANGYVTGVYTTTVSAIQVSAVSGDKYAVRFLAFDFMGDATNVSMNVIAKVQDGGAKSFTADCTMYDALTAYTAQGITERKAAEDFDAQKIAGFTIYNIPAASAIDYTVTVTYTTAAGTFSNVMTLTISVVDGAIVVTK